MPKPDLHIPLKDSPSTFLTVGIDDSETILQVADATAFYDAGITRLTLGIDEQVTETVEVISYGEDAYGAPDHTITVVRGTPSFAWGLNTTISRVFTAQDLDEVHDFLNYLDPRSVLNGDLHDHADGDGSQIPTEGIGNLAITTEKVNNNAIIDTKLGDLAVTTPKIDNGAVTTPKIDNLAITNDKLGMAAVASYNIGSGEINPGHIVNRTRYLMLPIMRYLSLSETSSNYVPNAWSTTAYGGVLLPTGVNAGNIGSWAILPSDFPSGGIAAAVIRPIMNTFLFSTAGRQAKLRYEVNIGELGQRIDSKTLSGDVAFEGLVDIIVENSAYVFQNPPNLTIPGTAGPGDILSIEFQRFGADALDNAGSINLRGFMLEYTADS